MTSLRSRFRPLALGVCLLPWLATTDAHSALHESKKGETKSIVQSERRLIRLGSSSSMEQHNDQHFSLTKGTALVDNRRKFGTKPVKISLRDHQVTVGEGTCLVEYQEGGYVKVVCMSGSVLLRTTSLFGEFIELKAGNMAIFNPVEPVLPVPVEINLERFVHTTRLMRSSQGALPNQKNLDSATAKQNAQFAKGTTTKTALVIQGTGTEVTIDGDKPKKSKASSKAESAAESAPAKADTKTAVVLANYQAVDQSMVSTLNMTSFHTVLSGAQHLLGIQPAVVPMPVVDRVPPPAPPVVEPPPVIAPPVTPPVHENPPPSTGGTTNPDPVNGYWEVNSSSVFSGTGLVADLKDGASLQLPLHSQSPGTVNQMPQRVTFVGSNDFSPLGSVLTMYSANANGGLTFGRISGTETTVYRYGSGSTTFDNGPQLSLAAVSDVSLYYAQLLLGHGTSSHLGVYSEESKVVFYQALVEATDVTIQAPVVNLTNSEIRSNSQHLGEIEIAGVAASGRGSYVTGIANNTDLKISNTKIGVNGTPNSIDISATGRRLFIQNSSQLKALALISLETQNSKDLRVEDSSLLVTQPGGEIVMSSAEDMHLHNVNLQASVIKASALGTNGWLHIQSSQFNATDLVQFFANETTGKIEFDGGRTDITSPITHMKASVIEVKNGSSVHISGDAYLEAQSHRYNTGGRGSINATNLHRDMAPPP